MSIGHFWTPAPGDEDGPGPLDDDWFPGTAEPVPGTAGYPEQAQDEITGTPGGRPEHDDYPEREHAPAGSLGPSPAPARAGPAPAVPVPAPQPGGSLRDELRDPRPETVRQHLAHIAGHRCRPGGRWRGLVFVAGYGTVTLPVKISGIVLHRAGKASVYIGARADWAGDRFARAVIPWAFLVTIIIVIAVFA